MKLLLRSLLLTCLLGALGAPSLLAAPAKKTVLVFFPNQFDLPAHALALQAIQAEFGQAADVPVDLYVEYLDQNRLPDPAYQRQVWDLYAVKYANQPVDLVLLDSETLLSLWLERRPSQLAATPVVLFDITQERLAAHSLPPEVVGVGGRVDYVPSVRWMLAARPAVNEVVLVRGVGPADQGFMQPVESLQAELAGQVKFTDLSGLPLAEVERRVAGLPPSSVVVCHLMFEDAAGTKYRPLDVVRAVSAASSAPVLVGYDQFIGAGALGGYTYSIEQQARAAAQIGLRRLRGEAVGNISDQNNRFIFDYPAVQRQRLPLASLPPASLVKNRPASFWERYQPEIMVFSLGLALLLVLVVFLLGLARQLNGARLQLAHLNASLEAQVRERTADLERAKTLAEQMAAELLENEARLKQAMKIARIGIWDWDIASDETQWFGAMFEIYGIQPEDFTGKGADYIGFTREDYRAQQRENIGRAFEKGVTEAQLQSGAALTFDPHELCIVRPDGSQAFTIGDAISIVDEAGQPKRMLGTSMDISERKQAEARLQESEARYRQLVENSPDIVYEYAPHSGGVFYSPRAAAVLGYPLEALYANPRLWHDSIHPDDLARVDRSIDEINSGETFTVEYRVRDARGEWRWLLDRSIGTRVASGETVIRGLATDITASKLAEQKLHASEARWQFALEGPGDGVWDWNVLSNEVFFSRQWKAMLGYAEHEIGATLAEWDQRLHPDDRARCYADLNRHFAGETPFYQNEHRARCKDGDYKWVLDRGKVVEWTAAGQPQRVIGTHTDITERKRTEDALRASLTEKEVLVKEVHHRVKNNLQIMVSLLNLQAERITDPASLAVFHDSRERVRTMALVHEKLYQSPDLARIQFGEYLRDLTQNLQSIYSPHSNVRVRVQAEPIWLGVDTAIPCGLLANELISNAFKYAFPDGRSGTLSVDLAQLPDPAASGARQFRLAIRDDGVGLPAELDPRATKSLGMQLAHILTRQLNGALTILPQPGATFEIVFTEKRERSL